MTFPLFPNLLKCSDCFVCYLRKIRNRVFACGNVDIWVSLCAPHRRIVSTCPTNPLNLGSSRWGLRVAGLVRAGHLDQTDYRGDGAHQAHQPAGESPCPQEAGRHPVDGVTEVGHALEGGEKLCSHLPAELRGTERRTRRCV